MNNIVTFKPFTTTRKAMIQHVKARLVDPKNRPTKHPVYGTKFPALFLEDYAVYAALRGADYRKTSHMEDGGNAKEAIEFVIRKLSNIKEPQNDLVSEGKHYGINKYLPEGSTYGQAAELKEILEQALRA